MCSDKGVENVVVYFVLLLCVRVLPCERRGGDTRYPGIVRGHLGQQETSAKCESGEPLYLDFVSRYT